MAQASGVGMGVDQGRLTLLKRSTAGPASNGTVAMGNEKHSLSRPSAAADYAPCTGVGSYRERQASIRERHSVRAMLQDGNLRSGTPARILNRRAIQIGAACQARRT